MSNCRRPVHRALYATLDDIELAGAMDVNTCQPQAMAMVARMVFRVLALVTLVRVHLPVRAASTGRCQSRFSYSAHPMLPDITG
jgi:hypothetical protein